MPRLPSATVAATAADAARRVQGVVDLDPGPLGTKVTYGGGGRVAGVTVRDDDGGRTITLHLKVGWGAVRTVADAVGDAVRQAVGAAYPADGPWRVDVEVSDIVEPGAGDAATSPGVDAAGPAGPVGVPS